VRRSTAVRHCGVSATGEWRRRRGVSEGLGVGARALGEWSFYTAGARVCLGGRWAQAALSGLTRSCSCRAITSRLHGPTVTP
jgi:hypothetical protein